MEPVSISVAMLGVITTTAVACGIILDDDSQITSLGVRFYEYVKEGKIGQTWEEVCALFNATTVLMSNGYVSTDSKFLDWIKSFLKEEIVDNSVNGLTGWYGGLPVYDFDDYYNNHAGALIGYDVNAWETLDMANGWADKYIATVHSMVLRYSNAQSYAYTIKFFGDNGVSNRGPIDWGSSYNPKAHITWSKDWNSHIRIGYLSKTLSDGRLGYIAFLGYVIEGVFNIRTSWNNSEGDIDTHIFGLTNPLMDKLTCPGVGEYDDTAVGTLPGIDIGDSTGVALPVPGDLGGLVGPGVIVGGLPGINTNDGTITVPGVVTDSPFVDVTTDSIPNEGDLDLPLNPPMDIPGTPNIPIPNVPIVPDIEIPGGEEGTLTPGDKDNWANSSGGNAGGLYYYYIGSDTGDSNNDDVIGHATGVVSLSYTPYLWFNDCNMKILPYDSERFGRPTNFKNFNVYRITEVTRPIKKMGGFTAYDSNFSVNIGEGKPYSYWNETKLYQYPYSFAYVYDGINTPLEIKYHYLKYHFNDVYIKQTVSDKCTYSLFVKGYKGDFEGNLESMVLTSGNELPCSSSTYAQWFATNRNQLAQNIMNIQNSNAVANHGLIQQNSIQNEMLNNSMYANVFGAILGGLGSLLTGNLLGVGGAIGDGVSGAINTKNNIKLNNSLLQTNLAMNKQNEQNAIQSAMAQNSDMRNAPATLTSHGSNVFYGLVNNNKKLLLLRMGLNEIDYYRIGTYFTMFGYKQNKVMNINLRSRKYFNYYKIVNPNIIGYKIPHNHMEKIKSIFREGITLWHYDNSDKVLDYFHSDNYEV